MATKYPKTDDPHVAEIYRAIALRFYMRYVDARHHAEYHGGDLPDHGRLPTVLEADEHYERAADGCVIELADSANAALALVRFAGVLAADKLAGEATENVINEERDAYHQARALANAARWLNEQSMGEFTDRVREERLPRCRRTTTGGMRHERRHRAVPTAPRD